MRKKTPFLVALLAAASIAMPVLAEGPGEPAFASDPLLMADFTFALYECQTEADIDGDNFCSQAYWRPLWARAMISPEGLDVLPLLAMVTDYYPGDPEKSGL